MRYVDFYFDFISPYSYLAAKKIPDFIEQNPIEIRWVPVNLPKLVKQSGNTPPSTIPKKAIYLLRDLRRWAALMDVPLKMIRPGSFDARPALNIASALDRSDSICFSGIVFDSLWSGEVDPREDRWLKRIFSIHDLPDRWLDLVGEKTSHALEEQTQLALKDGAFGAPTFVLHQGGRKQMFWGVDRMDFLARALNEGI